MRRVFVPGLATDQRSVFRYSPLPIEMVVAGQASPFLIAPLKKRNIKREDRRWSVVVSFTVDDGVVQLIDVPVFKREMVFQCLAHITDDVADSVDEVVVFEIR